MMRRRAPLPIAKAYFGERIHPRGVARRPKTGRCGGEAGVQRSIVKWVLQDYR